MNPLLKDYAECRIAMLYEFLLSQCALEELAGTMRSSGAVSEGVTADLVKAEHPRCTQEWLVLTPWWQEWLHPCGSVQ